MAPLGCQNTRPGPAASLMLNSSSSAPSFRWSLRARPAPWAPGRHAPQGAGRQSAQLPGTLLPAPEAPTAASALAHQSIAPLHPQHMCPNRRPCSPHSGTGTCACTIKCVIGSTAHKRSSPAASLAARMPRMPPQRTAAVRTGRAACAGAAPARRLDLELLVRLELLLALPGGAVDALQHRALLVAAPVRACAPPRLGRLGRPCLVGQPCQLRPVPGCAVLPPPRDSPGLESAHLNHTFTTYWTFNEVLKPEPQPSPSGAHPPGSPGRRPRG
jgi:hypothetical protein